MPLLNEEQIKKLRKASKKFPNVNESCIGCSACVAISDEVFELNDAWLSIVKSCDDYDWKGVDDAIAACPVDAISWQH